MFRNDILAGKRILVTGGGTGLGRCMSERYLELGASVVTCGRRKRLLDDSAADMMSSIGGTVETHHCDIRVADRVDEMVEEILRGSPLDGLVSNAAGKFIAQTKDLSPRGFDAIANIVLHGTFYMTQACGKRWINDGCAASVVSIVTTCVWTGSAYVVPSAMSKPASPQ